MATSLLQMFLIKHIYNLQHNRSVKYCDKNNDLIIFLKIKMQSQFNQEAEGNMQSSSEQTKKGISATSQISRDQTEVQLMKNKRIKSQEDPPERFSFKKQSSRDDDGVFILKKQMKVLIAKDHLSQPQKQEAIEKSFQKYLTFLKAKQESTHNLKSRQNEIIQQIHTIENNLVALKYRQDWLKQDLQKHKKKLKKKQQLVSFLQNTLGKQQEIKEKYLQFYEQYQLQKNKLIQLTPNTERNKVEQQDINRILQEIYEKFLDQNSEQYQQGDVNEQSHVEQADCKQITEISQSLCAIKKKLSQKYEEKEQKQQVQERNEVIERPIRQDVLNESQENSIGEQSLIEIQKSPKSSVRVDPQLDKRTCNNEKMSLSVVVQSQND